MTKATFDEKYRIGDIAQALNIPASQIVEAVNKYSGKDGIARARDDGNILITEALYNEHETEELPLSELYAAARGQGKMIQEAITRNSAIELLRDAYNSKFMQGYDETAYQWNMVYDTMNIETKNVTLPFAKGVWVNTTPEGGEIEEVTIQSGTATITPAKYTSLVNVTNEMIADNEVGLVGWLARRTGRRFREKDDSIAFAVFDAIAAASLVTGAVVGVAPTNPGYATMAELLVDIKAGDLNLEIRTETVGGGGAQKAPVHADVCLLPAGCKYSAHELFNAIYTYSGDAGGITNVFSRAYPNLNFIITPYLTAGSGARGYMLKAFDNAVRVLREAVSLDEEEDFIFDTTRTRAKMRVAYAVGEADKIAGFPVYT